MQSPAGARGSGRAGGVWSSAPMPRQASTPTRRSEGLPRSAADLDSDARATSEILKDVLRSHPPWSRDVEAHRQKARNLFLSLLFGHPLSTHSQSLEPLWHHTTYTLISAYRAITANLEASLPPPTTQRKNHKANNSPQQMELKKVLTRFRQILISEEAFYRNLISRLVHFYQLQDLSRDILSSVSIGVSEPHTGHNASDTLAPDLSNEERREKLTLVYKSLVCLGDLERYKEQYEDKYRKEAREGRINPAKHHERFNKSSTYYEVARALVPDDGSAFNQMAVISTYLGDDFLCVYYYFRALAVRHAFKNISEILDKFLRKVLERWNARRDQESDEDAVTAAKADLLVLTAIIGRRHGFSAFDHVQSTFLPALGRLMKERQLPSEMIVKITVIAIGSHWQARQAASIAPEHEDQALIERRHQAETFSLSLVLGLYTQMLEVSASEIDEALRVRAGGSAVAGDDEALHQYISASLRRLLPALRILSKWLKLHLEYVTRQPSDLASFWQGYTRLAINLATLFPIDQLPSLSSPLEEDVDMRGFIPLSRGMISQRQDDEHDSHPNEEQLMRIADLQVDSKLLAQSQSGQTALSPQHIHQPLPLPALGSFTPRDRADDMASVSTETEDDPVNMAMRATLGGSTDGEDGDEEIILWGGAQPVKSPPTAQDLLQNLMLNTPSPPVPQKHASPFNPNQSSPGMLFGGDTTGASIWSMTRQESQNGRATQPRQAPNIAAIWGDAPTPQHNGAIGQGRPLSGQPVAAAGWTSPGQPQWGMPAPQQMANGQYPR